MFKKKLKVDAKGPEDTLQQLQEKFNNIIFRLGDLHYRKAMISAQLGNLSNDIAELLKQGEALGAKASAISSKIKQEVAATVQEGQPGEESIE